jgi:hypothetical protein
LGAKLRRISRRRRELFFLQFQKDRSNIAGQASGFASGEARSYSSQPPLVGTDTATDKNILPRI